LDTNYLNTFFTGKFLMKLDEIDSTNNFLKAWVANNKPIEGTVILTEKQNAGRGQAGTSWQSKSGENITLSVLYTPSFLEARNQFVLSAAVALGVYEAVSAVLPSKMVKIKWPNDILLENKKVCGILIENSLMGSYLQNSIIGIGLNVLQTDFGDLSLATSLKKEGYTGEVDNVIKILLENLEAQYLRLKSGRYESILEDYHAHLLGKDEVRSFIADDVSFEGIIQGVENDGRLRISTTNGDRLFYHKEVSFVLL